uniref:Uncharacterized protein n=1 Tax=uncultured Armatimonadetes bacterium TaxID=157466 RepID=A0A6J4JRA4_9BACT|nr:hypothetical protein AVDCRST_MAG63-3916 [uncultured Armatimonadetes bacterium]
MGCLPVNGAASLQTTQGTHDFIIPGFLRKHTFTCGNTY